MYSDLMADENSFRFSTKYYDGETDFYYYGYRYYSTQLGRWINRDPLGERGGINIYLFSLNNSINIIDILGLENLSGGSYLVIENPTGILGEWYESDAEKAAVGLGMKEGFENKWAEKNEIQESFQTAEQDDIVIFTGHSYHSGDPTNYKGISPANKPFYEFFAGDAYSKEEMIEDLNKNEGAPAILIFVSCRSKDFAEEIWTNTDVKVVLATDKNLSNTGEMTSIVRAFFSELNQDVTINQAVYMFNSKRGANRAKLEVYAGERYINQPIKKLLSN